MRCRVRAAAAGRGADKLLMMTAFVLPVLFDMHLAAHNSRAGVAFLRQILADAVDADWAASEERAARRKRVPGREEGAATEVAGPWLPPSPNTTDYCPSNGAFEFCPVFQGESIRNPHP